MHPQNTHIYLYAHLFVDVIKGLKAILDDIYGRLEAPSVCAVKMSQTHKQKSIYIILLIMKFTTKRIRLGSEINDWSFSP